MILYVRAETLEYFDPLARRMFWFGGRSVFQLRLALENNLHEDTWPSRCACGLAPRAS